VRRRPFQVDDEMIDRATRNYLAMAGWAKAAGIPLAFITYPVEFATFAAVNRAIRAAPAETRTPVIESRYSIADLPLEKRILEWNAHPNGWMYREIARDVAELVLRTLPPPLPG